MRCKHIIKYEEKIFSNGSRHIEKRCIECNRFLGYERQKKPIKEDHIVCFGKYKNKTIKEIYDLDINYLEWFANSEPYNFYKKSILEFLEGKRRENNL